MADMRYHVRLESEDYDRLTKIGYVIAEVNTIRGEIFVVLVQPKTSDRSKDVKNDVD